MDALSAATTTKKDALTRKRKRRPSLTKDATATTGKSDTLPGEKQPDENESVADEPIVAEEGSDEAANIISKDESIKVAPMKFYTDTLSTEAGIDTSKETTTKTSDEFDPKADSTDDEDDDTPLNRLMDQSLDGVKDSEDVAKRSSPITAAAAAQFSDDDDNSSSVPLVKTPGPGCGPNGPPGVLIVHRRKGPKKQLRWRPQEQLEEVRFFELDENERINVTKTFVDMKQMERSNEREGFIMARKLTGEDNMTEQIPWSALLFVVEDVPPHPDGANSKERETQKLRELACLKSLYFNRLMIPDNPAEPDFEVPPPMQEPQVIPLDDVTGNPDAVNDFTSLVWPESRGSAPNPVGPVNNMDHGNMPFNQQHQENGFPIHGQPFGFGPKPGAGMQNWNPNGNMPPQMMDGPPPGFNMMNGPDMMMGPGNMNGPGPMMGPMRGPGPMGPMGPMNGPPMNGPPMNGPPMNGPPMNGPPMNGPPMNGPPMNGGGRPPFGPGGPNNFGPPPRFNNNNNNFNERGGNPPWFRQNGPPGPENNWRGGGHNNHGGNRPPWLNRSRICKNFSKGFCRHGEKCNFLHPGENCPLF